jgi:hypothetical protein
MGLSMTDKAEADKPPDEKHSKPGRRPWHAPRFILTDVASTEVQGNAGSDGGPMGSLS